MRAKRSILGTLALALVVAVPTEPALAQRAQGAVVEDSALTPPDYEVVTALALPSHYCSEAEKDGLLRALALETNKAVANAHSAEWFAQAVVDEGNKLKAARRPLPARLRQLAARAGAEFEEAIRVRGATYGRLKSAQTIPVSDCREARADSTGGQRSSTGEAIWHQPGLDRRAALAVSPTQRRAVTEELLRLLDPHRARSPEARQASAVLRLLLDRDAIRERSQMDAAILALERGTSPAAKRAALQTLGAEVIDRARHFTGVIAHGEYSAADATRILKLTKYASQLRDDLSDWGGAPTGQNTTNVTRFMAAAYGAAALAHGLREGEAREVMDGVRDLTAGSATLAGTTWTTFDVPAEVAASLIGVTREGLETAAAVVDEFPAAITGDERALARAIARSRELEGTLSGASYGNAMMAAMTSRIADRVPLLRTILAWWAGRQPAATPVEPRGTPSSANAAVTEIRSMQRTIRDWKTRMDALYGYYGAPRTLRTAFEQQGIVWAMDYVSSWGGWIYMDWAAAREFADYHLGQLQASERNVLAYGAGAVIDLQSLRRGMGQWTPNASAIESAFEEKVEALAERARFLEDAHLHGGDRGPALEAENRAEQAAVRARKLGELQLFGAIPAPQR